LPLPGVSQAAVAHRLSREHYRTQGSASLLLPLLLESGEPYSPLMSLCVPPMSENQAVFIRPTQRGLGRSPILSDETFSTDSVASMHRSSSENLHFLARINRCSGMAECRTGDERFC